MDTLHSVLRTIHHENKARTAPRRDHLTVFREFLDHLDRAARRRRAPAGRTGHGTTGNKAKSRRGR